MFDVSIYSHYQLELCAFKSRTLPSNSEMRIKNDVFYHIKYIQTHYAKWYK